MAKLSIKVGTTSKLVSFFVQDSSKTVIAGLTALTSGSAGLIAAYKREGDVVWTAFALAAGTQGTWSSGGFVEEDSTKAPGMYELGLPNAAVASGKSCRVYLQGATNMSPVVLEIELTANDNQDAVRGGLTALPNAAASAAGGLLTFGNGAGQLSVDGAGRITTTYGLHKNTLFNNFEFPMVDGTDHVSPKLGLTVAGQVSLDGVGFVNLTNAVTEIANGIYKVNLAAADLNGTMVVLKFTATGADPTSIGMILQT